MTPNSRQKSCNDLQDDDHLMDEEANEAEHSQDINQQQADSGAGSQRQPATGTRDDTSQAALLRCRWEVIAMWHCHVALPHCSLHNCQFAADKRPVRRGWQFPAL